MHAKKRLIKEIESLGSHLQDAASGENYEHSNIYVEFKRVAREEGYDEIADVFHEIAEAEKEYEKRFLALLNNIEKGTVFKRDEEVKWRCRNCGYD